MAQNKDLTAKVVLAAPPPPTRNASDPQLEAQAKGAAERKVEQQAKAAPRREMPKVPYCSLGLIGAG